MPTIVVTGRHQTLSREEIRAMAQATLAVLEFHNLTPRTPVVKVRIVHDIEVLDSDPGDPDRIVGRANRDEGSFRVVDDMTFQDTLTVVIHEIIHLCLSLKKSREKVVSTLTGRIKPDVAKVADVLVAGTYRRAGYFAHIKISYPTDGPDYYDHGSQYRKVQTEQAGKKYRVDPPTVPPTDDGTVV